MWDKWGRGIRKSAKNEDVIYGQSLGCKKVSNSLILLISLINSLFTYFDKTFWCHPAPQGLRSITNFLKVLIFTILCRAVVFFRPAAKLCYTQNFKKDIIKDEQWTRHLLDLTFIHLSQRIALDRFATGCKISRSIFRLWYSFEFYTDRINLYLHQEIYS